MSELTAEELAAGISRRAIATLRHPRRVVTSQRQNGKAASQTETVKPDSPSFLRPAAPVTPPPAGSLEQHLRSAKENRIESPERTAVVDTWDRQLDIVNLDGWNFRLRDTRHERGIHVDSIELDRVELEMLARRISQVLSQKSR